MQWFMNQLNQYSMLVEGKYLVTFCSSVSRFFPMRLGNLVLSPVCAEQGEQLN